MPDRPTFHQALNTVIAELTPQPWGYTAPDGTTLTVIPAGLREDHGRAEVMIRVTVSKTEAAEIGIRTTDMPGLLAALDKPRSYSTLLYDAVTIAPADTGGLVLTVVEEHYASFEAASRYETRGTVHLPEVQRLPLVSALRRATDVARGWEDEPEAGESRG